MEEPFDFRDDGTIVVRLYEGEVSLRRPRMGEFVKLREDLENRQDEAAPVAERLNRNSVAVQNLGAEERSTEEAMAMVLNLRQDTREARELGERTRVEWLLLVIQTLGPHEVIVNEDDLLPDVLQGTWPAEMIDHWKSRPTDPGAS